MVRRLIDDWTLCILTIPSRDKYLRKLIGSVMKVQERMRIKVLYNCPRDKAGSLASRLIKDYEEIETLFCPEESNEQNGGDKSLLFSRPKKYGISQGRNQLLNSVGTPLLSFIDDDCTLEGKDIFHKLEERFRETSLGLIGLPSYCKDSSILIKPRRVYEKRSLDEIIYTGVIGMFAASYTQLLKDFGGFNERKDRMEWTDLNTRIQRGGYPTGIDMEAGLVRHWIDAPDSPTRIQEGRTHLGLLYCLCSTALEFECLGDSLSTRKMWELIINDGYYQGELSYEQLLIDILNVTPQILEDKEEIENYRKFLNSLPFKFMPYSNLKEKDWLKLIEYSTPQIEKYKTTLK